MSNSAQALLSTQFERCADAIVDGNLKALTALISQHPELIHARSVLDHHSTLLFYVTANSIENDRQRTPDNIVEIAQFLLEQGADPNALSDAYGGDTNILGSVVSSAHPAHADKQADLVRLLCRYGADPNIKNNAPIKTAIAFRYPKAVEALIDCGAKSNHVVLAAAVGDMKRVKKFIKRGVKPFTTAFGVKLRDAQTVLEFACISASMMGQVDVVAYLLEQGVDINAKQSAEGGTALHEASITGQQAVIDLLLKSGADVTSQDNHGSTPLHLAAWHQQHSAIDSLLKYGADLERLNGYGGTVLDAAVYGFTHSYYEVKDPLPTLQKLLDAGADADAVIPYPTGNSAIDNLLKPYRR